MTANIRQHSKTSFGSVRLYNSGRGRGGKNLSAYLFGFCGRIKMQLHLLLRARTWLN